MTNAFYITGTGTNVGKTTVACGLLAAASRHGLSTLGFKPVAAGCITSHEGHRNSDALALMAQSTMVTSYEQVNPVALEEAIAPHIAANDVGFRLSADHLASFFHGAMMQRPEFMVVEGAGGWKVPLNEQETFADFAKIIQLPVVLVVAMELGCINHTLLTVEAIQRDGLSLAGWVANRVQPKMARYEENLTTLQHWLPCPMVAEIPFTPVIESINVADFIKLELLLG